MHLHKMVPVCICFLFLIITITTVDATVPQHLRRSNQKEDSLSEKDRDVNVGAIFSHLINNGEENQLTPDEISDFIHSKNEDGNSNSKSDAEVLGVSHEGNLKEEISSKKNDLTWWWDEPNWAHNLVVGNKTSQDLLLVFRLVYIPYSFLRIVEEDLVYAPPKNKDQYIIDFIKAIDWSEDPSDAGFVRITSGGIGQRHVTLHFESKRNYDLKYLVSIWGHRTSE